MGITLVKRVAASILKCGTSRVWIDPNNIEKAKKAITRKDVKNLIKLGIIKKLPEKEQKGNKKKLEQKKKGRRKGKGSRKGAKGARQGKKMLWIKTVRAQRKLLKNFKEKGLIEKNVYRKLYRLVKGGMFRSRKHLLTYMKEKGLIKGEE
jgi:large subunit ribosomal protein L19e